MEVKNNIRNSKIKKIINQHYGINPTLVENFKSGNIDSYKVEEKEKQFVLKEIEPKIPEERIRENIKALNFIKKSDYYYYEDIIYTKENKPFFYYKEKRFVLKTFLQGKRVEKKTFDDEKLKDLAKVFANVTKSLSGFEPKYIEKIDDWFINSNINDDIGLHKNLIKKARSYHKSNIHVEIYNHLEKKLKVLEIIIKNKNNINKIKNTSYINSFGTFSCENVLYTNDKVSGIVNFGNVRKISLPLEIGKSFVSFHSLCAQGELNFNKLELYIYEISKYINLKRNDIVLIPLILMYYYALSLDGYYQFLNEETNYDSVEKADFKTNIMIWIFNNLHILEKRLKNLKLYKEKGED